MDITSVTEMDDRVKGGWLSLRLPKHLLRLRRLRACWIEEHILFQKFRWPQTERLRYVVPHARRTEHVDECLRERPVDSDVS